MMNDHKRLINGYFDGYEWIRMDIYIYIYGYESMLMVGSWWVKGGLRDVKCGLMVG